MPSNDVHGEELWKSVNNLFNETIQEHSFFAGTGCVADDDYFMKNVKELISTHTANAVRTSSDKLLFDLHEAGAISELDYAHWTAQIEQEFDRIQSLKEIKGE